MGGNTDVGKKAMPWPSKLEKRLYIPKIRRSIEKKALRKHEEP